MKPTLNDTVLVTGLSNSEFLERYAGAGRIGLSSGMTLVDRAICRAERHLHDTDEWGSWSHSFLFQGRRPDGHHWLIESDLQMHRKHLQFGVQENRVSKYHDEGLYTALAVLDFGLQESQIECLLREALELVAGHARYSLRELVGALVALRHAKLRGRSNLLARESCLFCSAFIQHLFLKTGLDLAPGVDHKNTTPEHLAQAPVPHITYVLKREVPRKKARKLRPGANERSG